MYGIYIYAEFIRTANSFSVRPKDLAFVAAKPSIEDSFFRAIPLCFITSGSLRISNILGTIVSLITFVNAEELKKVGKFKDWEALVLINDAEKICFARSKPVLQSPKKNSREARLFVSFRPNKKILDEISITAGYEFNKKNSITARSGKNKYKFDISQESFAWMADDKEEKKMIKAMKRGSRIMITGYNQEGSQTIDHYSLLGFTKAYGAAKKSCS